MAKHTQIRFRDFLQREKKERDRLNARLAYLEEKNTKRGGANADSDKPLHLPALEAEELKRHREIFQVISDEALSERIDPLFVGVRDLLNRNPALLGSRTEKRWVLNFDDKGSTTFCPGKEGDEKNADLFRSIATLAIIVGMLDADQVVPPPVKVIKPKEAYLSGAHLAEGGCAEQLKAIRIVSDDSHVAYPEFRRAFFDAVGRNSDPGLATQVLSHLEDLGHLPGVDAGTVDAVEFAKVVLCLIQQGIRAGDIKEGKIQLTRKVSECLDKIQKVGNQDPISNVGIDLPDLTTVSDYQIKPDNVKLMGPIICSAMFEELKVFQVLDKLVELSQNGMLPIGEGEAGKKLYLYWKDTPNRISESERHSIYAQTLGIPGGPSDGPQNREFNDLWLRFMSAVSTLVRQRTADNLLRNNLPAAISQQQVRKAARDLAMNLSSRGYGMTFYLALDLNAQINNIISILSDRDLRASYGANNMWQMIEAVSTLELGGAKNTARYSTLANCGGIITAWLANNIDRYNRPTGRAVIDVDEVLSIDPATSNEPTKTPTDYDLVNACELWLADTATSDQRIEEMSQPREAPIMTSRPVQIPAIAKDMLDQAGVAVPGFGMAASSWR